MLITSSDKPLCVIGIAQSTITQEVLSFLSNETTKPVVLITPDEFLVLTNKTQYQYIVFFTLDIELRKDIINIIEINKLDCFSIIHDTVVIYKNLKELSTEKILDIVGHGSFIAPFSSILLNSTVGKHCIIETYCLVSHYCKLGTNVILHSGTMIAGRTIIGNNCMFNFKSTALNALTICDNVEVGAISTVTKDIAIPGLYIGTIARHTGNRITFNG